MSTIDAPRSLVLALLLIVPLNSLAQPTHDWGVSVGGPLYDIGTAVATDDDGNIWVSGSLHSPTLGFGYTHVFLAKLDPNGDLLWSKTFGPAGLELARGIAVDQTGKAVLVGGFLGSIDFGGGPLNSAGSSDVFVASFDENGEHRWSHRYGGAERDVAYDVDAGADGSFTFGGTFISPIDFGGGPFGGAPCQGVFVVRLDGNGNHVWSRQKKSNFSMYSLGSVAVRDDGGVYAGGWSDFCQMAPNASGLIMNYDASGDSLWVAHMGNGLVSAIVADHPDGGVVAVGWGENVSTELPEAKVVKFDANRFEQWERGYGAPSAFYFHALATSVAGDIVAVGELRTSIDFGDGTITSAGGYDVGFLNLDANGENPKSFRFGGAGNEDALAVVCTQPGRCVVAGKFTDSVVMGDDSLSSAGNSDIFVTQIRYRDFVSVAISAFHAELSRLGVVLRARFASNLTVDAVNVYRTRESEPWRRTATVPPGASDEFVFEDTAVGPGLVYRYQIGVVDADGEFFSPVETVAIPIVPSALEQNRPNPFNPTTTIRFNLAHRGHATVTIWNAEGRRVRTLVDEELAHGPHEAIWDGRDESGVSVGSGVYFYRLRAGGFVDSKKMVLLK